MVVTRVARFRCRQFKKRAEASKPLRVNCSRAFRKPRHLRCSRDSADSQGLAVAGAPVKGLEQKLQETKRLGALSSRMMAGRTLQRLQGLQNTSLLNTCRSIESPASGAVPVAGLTAELHGTAVLVLHTFVRHGKTHAHVAPIVPTANKKPPQGADSFLDRRRSSTCREEELTNLGVAWQVVGFVRHTVYLKHTSFAGTDLPMTSDLLSLWEGLRNVAAAPVDIPCSDAVTDWAPAGAKANIVIIFSASAEEHQRKHKHHKLVPVGRVKEPVFLLDLPFPRILDMSLRRCETCHQHFQPQPEDVLRVMPDVVLYRNPSHFKQVRYMTHRYLLNLLLAIYDLFNLRGVRRRLTSIMFASATVHVLSGVKPMSPHSLGAMVLAVPTAQELKIIALKAFTIFVQKQVDHMVDQQCLYNFSVLRGDGHYDVAAGVYEYDAKQKARKYPFTCILAWCGTDGSLLKPFVVAPGEAFHDQVKDLEPFLRKAKSLRMTHDLSSTDSRPTVHATDTYNKHRLLWPPIYDKVWMEQQVDAQGHTKKGDVCKVQRSGVGESDATMVTGEPMHELINLRRVLPSVGHDFADIYFDHAEAGLGILLTFQCSICFGHEIGAADTGKMCYGFSFC